MWQSILWEIILILLRAVFNVSKDFMVKAIEEVGKANELKHPDGSAYTGKEKYDVVFDALVMYSGQYDWRPQSSTINAVIEMVVSYLKSKKTEG